MKNVIKISSKICGALLAVLGFSALITSCGPKYGMPQEVILGKVTDKVTGKPIKGIKVTNWYGGLVPMYGVVPTDYVEMSGFTDKNGNYRISTDEIQPNLSFSDVDGAENGLYNDTAVTVDVRIIALTPKE